MALKEGTQAPNFKFKDRDGNDKEFYDVDGKRIVFFFPQAFTPGCTAQACSLRDNYANLKGEGISEVFGISIDSEEKLAKFKKEHGLDYILIADTDGEISKSYDVYNNFLLKKMSGRVTYTVDPDNTIHNTVNSGIMGKKVEHDLSEHGTDLLNLIKQDK